MIVRYFVICETCEHPHTLRIQVGHESYQEHTFHCSECEEEIVVGMECDQLLGSLKIVEVRNCTRGSKEGTIVNLSSGFPVAKADLHRDMVFPSIQHMQDISKVQKSLGIEHPAFSSLQEARDWHLKHKGVNELWPTVKKGWSLTGKKKFELAAKKLGKYREGEFTDPLELQYVLFDFCGRMLGLGKFPLFENAAKVTEKINKARPIQMQEFRIYFKSGMAAENLERYFDTFREYFGCFNDFSQTLMHIQLGIPISDDFEATSSAFAKTKLFYGNAYETLTSNVATLACINNIGSGRTYDTFQTMDLKKYLTLNKANRCNPFKDTLEFQRIGASLESTIRNASHHGGMKLINKGRAIEYKSGGTGQKRSMTYLSYVNQCNEIMLSCCALLALELAIAF